MNRINNGDCLLYADNDKFIGKFYCYFDTSMGMETSVQNVIIIRDCVHMLSSCGANIEKSNFRVQIIKKFKEKYYMLNFSFVRSLNIEIEENDFHISIDEDITNLIETISEQQYNEILEKGTIAIEWENIKENINGKIVSKDKAFELLCLDLINQIRNTKENDFHPLVGADGGIDYEWDWPSVDTNIDFLDLPKVKWIMQCKYSKDINTEIKIEEIWANIVQVMQYKPDHYIIATNRKRKKSFKDWWDNKEELSGKKISFIPFSLHFFTRENIERLLNMYTDIKKKYFN